MALVVGAVNCASSMEESSESEWCRVQRLLGRTAAAPAVVTHTEAHCC